ncbi:MAG: hypothetical protein PHT84_00185 [Candidatus Pacebacteria bacterium]|nr:hypothetical protein [Candidatus Paceibacterota bacterium]
MKKKQTEPEDRPFAALEPLNNNDPELEKAYLKSYPMDRKDLPENAKLIGTVEVLAFTAEIFQDEDGDFISCVQER